MIDYHISPDILADPTKCRVCNNKLKLHIDNTGISSRCSVCNTKHRKFTTNIWFVRCL